MTTKREFFGITLGLAFVAAVAYAQADKTLPNRAQDGDLNLQVNTSAYGLFDALSLDGTFGTAVFNNLSGRVQINKESASALDSSLDFLDQGTIASRIVHQHNGDNLRFIIGSQEWLRLTDTGELQWISPTTGSAGSDGFIIDMGTNVAGGGESDEVRLLQQEDRGLSLGNFDNPDAFVVDSGGSVYLNDASSNVALQVTGGTRAVSAYITSVGSGTDVCSGAGGNALGQLQTCTSSIRFKKNVQTITAEERDRIYTMRGVKFDWKNTDKPDYGVIAEEVAQIYPRLANYDAHGQIEGVNYRHMVGVLVEVVKDLNKRVEDLEAQLEK